MAIRHIKTTCMMNWDDRVKLEQDKGKRIGNCRVTLSARTGNVPQLSMDNGEQTQLALFFISQDKTTHVGRVVAVEVDHGVRVMSDVWADITYAIVFEPTREHTGVFSTEIDWSNKLPNGEYGQKPRGACSYFRRIPVSNSEFETNLGELISWEIDAPADIMEIYEAAQRGGRFRAALRDYDHREERALDTRRTVAIDKWVRVIRGRKVRQGTEGLVFWSNESPYGTKLGIAIPREDGSFRKTQKTGRYGKVFDNYADVAWTYSKNCAVIRCLGGPVL